MSDLIPKTKITITNPLPTTASTSMVGGKLHLEFDIDLAAEIGRAVLDGRKPDVASLVTKALSESAKVLFASVAIARQIPKGKA